MLGVPKESMRMEGVQPVAVPRGQEVHEYGSNAMSFKLLLGGGEEAAKMAGNVEDLNDGMQFDRMMVDFGSESEKVVSGLKNDPNLANNPAAWAASYKEQMNPVMSDLKGKYGNSFMGASGLFKAEGELEKAMKINLARVSKESMDRVGDMVRDESIASVLYMRDMGNFEGAKSVLGSPYIDDATRLRLSASIETGEMVQRYKVSALNDPMNVKKQLVAGDSLDGMKLNPAMRLDAMNFASNVLNQKQGEYFDGVMQRYGETGLLPSIDAMRDDLENQRISPSQFFRIEREKAEIRKSIPADSTEVGATINIASGMRAGYAVADTALKAKMEYKLQQQCDERRIKGDARSLIMNTLKASDEDVAGVNEIGRLVENKARIETKEWVSTGRTVEAKDISRHKSDATKHVSIGELINGKPLLYERVVNSEKEALLTNTKAKAQDMFLQRINGRDLPKEERAKIMRSCVDDAISASGIEGKDGYYNITDSPKSEFTKAKEKKAEFVGASIDPKLSNTQAVVHSKKIGGDGMGLAVSNVKGELCVKVLDVKRVESDSESASVSNDLAALMGGERNIQVVVAPDESMFDCPDEDKIIEKAKHRASQICDSLGNKDDAFNLKVREALAEYWNTKK